MLRIRPQQQFLRILTEDGFVAWYVTEFMPDNLPQFHEALPEERLAAMVRAGHRTALGQGLSEPDAIAHFVTLMWLVGPNFRDFPGFREVLARTDLSDRQRIQALYQVDSDLAATAIVHADDGAWWRAAP